MKILYMGTAAAEGWPGLFCSCYVCSHARKVGGRNLRIRTQTLLDDELLLDFPPDSDCRALRCGLDAGKLRTLFDHPWKRPFLTISSSPAPGI